VGYVDASHATDLRTRRSVTGLFFCLAGGVIPRLSWTALPPPFLHYSYLLSPIVDTVSDDDSVLGRRRFSGTTPTYLWNILVVKSDVPNSTPDPFSDELFVSSGTSCVH
jgi:hypothetical protein